MYKWIFFIWVILRFEEEKFSSSSSSVVCNRAVSWMDCKDDVVDSHIFFSPVSLSFEFVQCFPLQNIFLYVCTMMWDALSYVKPCTFRGSYFSPPVFSSIPILMWKHGTVLSSGWEREKMEREGNMERKRNKIPPCFSSKNALDTARNERERERKCIFSRMHISQKHGHAYFMEGSWSIYGRPPNIQLSQLYGARIINTSTFFIILETRNKCTDITISQKRRL